MTASYDKTKSQARSTETQNVVDVFNKLDTDAKLALLYLVYKKMGKSVTPAAPAATEPELAPFLLGNFYDMSGQQQLDIMRQIVNCADTEYSHDYGALKENNQLMVWYAWAQAMGDTVVGMPDNYQASESINNVLSQIEKLDFDDQISILRTIAGEMGYTNIKPIETQAQTGKTSSF